MCKDRQRKEMICEITKLELNYINIITMIIINVIVKY